MTDPLDIADQLLDGRRESIRELRELDEATKNAAAALAEAQRNQAAAWTKANRAGWTDSELRKMGFTKPTGRGGRKRKDETKGSASQHAPSAPETSSTSSENVAETATPPAS